jgi:hypothetical protein
LDKLAASSGVNVTRRPATTIPISRVSEPTYTVSISCATLISSLPTLGRAMLGEANSYFCRQPMAYRWSMPICAPLSQAVLRGTAAKSVVLSAVKIGFASDHNSAHIDINELRPRLAQLARRPHRSGPASRYRIPRDYPTCMRRSVAKERRSRSFIPRSRSSSLARFRRIAGERAATRIGNVEARQRFQKNSPRSIGRVESSRVATKHWRPSIGDRNGGLPGRYQP